MYSRQTALVIGAYTPRDWLRIYNLAKGAAFGLSHDFWQVGYLRPHNRHPRYGNLYFVGSSTHPGAGLPMALLSARLTTERIVEEIGVPQRLPHWFPTARLSNRSQRARA